MRLYPMKKSAPKDSRQKKALFMVFSTWNFFRKRGSGERSSLFLEPGAVSDGSTGAAPAFGPAAALFAASFAASFAADFAAAFAAGTAGGSNADPASDLAIVFTGVFAGVLTVGFAGGAAVSFCGSFAWGPIAGLAAVFAAGTSFGTSSDTGSGAGSGAGAGDWLAQGLAGSITSGNMAAEHRGQKRASSGHVAPQFLQIMAYLRSMQRAAKQPLCFPTWDTVQHEEPYGLVKISVKACRQPSRLTNVLQRFILAQNWSFCNHTTQPTRERLLAFLRLVHAV